MKKYIIIATLIINSSCTSNISSKWAGCRKTDSKLGCASISKADEVAAQKEEESSLQNLTPTNTDEKYHSFQADDIGGNQHLSRTRDKIGRLWIAPYMDKNNNFHEGSYVRVVDQSSAWQLRKIKSSPVWKKKSN
jgi:hypothetical protein